MLMTVTPPSGNWLHFETTKPMVWFQSSTTSPRIEGNGPIE
jgi:hypothetical protein